MIITDYQITFVVRYRQLLVGRRSAEPAGKNFGSVARRSLGLPNFVYRFPLVATIASGRYISRLLPWNTAFSLTWKRERSTRSQRVNFQCRSAVGFSCSKPTIKCIASSPTLLVATLGSK